MEAQRHDPRIPGNVLRVLDDFVTAVRPRGRRAARAARGAARRRRPARRGGGSARRRSRSSGAGSTTSARRGPANASRGVSLPSEGLGSSSHPSMCSVESTADEVLSRALVESAGARAGRRTCARPPTPPRASSPASPRTRSGPRSPPRPCRRRTRAATRTSPPRPARGPRSSRSRSRPAELAERARLEDDRARRQLRPVFQERLAGNRDLDLRRPELLAHRREIADLERTRGRARPGRPRG